MPNDSFRAMRLLPSGHCWTVAAGENLPAEPLPFRKRCPEPRQSAHAVAGGEAEGLSGGLKRYGNLVEMGQGEGKPPLSCRVEVKAAQLQEPITRKH